MKKVLMIITGFAPQNRIGAIRTTKIAKYLVRHGYDITVIAPEISDVDIVDNTLISSELSKMSILRISNGVLFNKTLYLIRNKVLKEKSASSYIAENKKSFFGKIKKAIVQKGLYFYQFAESYSWQKHVKKTIEDKLKDNFDVIISSYPKASTHKIASNLLRNNNKSLWIADFRDPMTYETLSSKSDYHKNFRLQKYFCENASVVTYVTENMLKKLTSGIEDQKKFHYLPNGFDEDDLKSIGNSNKTSLKEYHGIFKVAYVGNLYGGKRDISIFFKKIREMIEKGKLDINYIKFFYAGKDFYFLKEQAIQFKLDKILINLGFISREESLRLQEQSNLIIVNTWNTEKDQGVIPGKVYECFLLKKPTLAIINGTKPNSELGNMITKARLGLSYDTMVNNQKADLFLEEYIYELYKSVINKTGYELNINLEYIDQFNYKTIVENLNAIIQLNSK